MMNFEGTRFGRVPMGGMGSLVRPGASTGAPRPQLPITSSQFPAPVVRPSGSAGEARPSARGTGFGPDENRPQGGAMGSFKKGGKVGRTGNYRLHKGEVVVPKGKTGSMAMLMKARRAR